MRREEEDASDRIRLTRETARSRVYCVFRQYYRGRPKAAGWLGLSTSLDRAFHAALPNSVLARRPTHEAGDRRRRIVYLEYPAHYSVLLVGPPGAGKLEYALELVRHYFGRDERVVFVTLDISPDEIRERARRLGLDLERHEGSEFVFVDCYSSNATDRFDTAVRKGTFTVSSFSNLEGIGMTISKAAHELRPPVRILFYTVSTLFLHNSPQVIAKFIQIITSRVKSNTGFILYAVHDGVHEPITMSLLQSLVDGVVEMRFNDAMEREIRVHHLRGVFVDPRWERFEPMARIETALGGT